MIALAKKPTQKTSAAEPERQFAAFLPQIKSQLSFAFRHLDDEARDEAIQEGLANCWQAFVSLHQRGRGELAYASVLARFAIRQVNAGRQVGARLNVHEPLSRYAQLNKGMRVERLDQRCEAGPWLRDMIEDRRASIPDQVALRIDVPVWLRCLSQRTRAIAEDLASGCTTTEVAKKYSLSLGRISQLRRQLRESWHSFHNRDAAEAKHPSGKRR